MHRPSLAEGPAEMQWLLNMIAYNFIPCSWKWCRHFWASDWGFVNDVHAGWNYYHNVVVVSRSEVFSALSVSPSLYKKKALCVALAMHGELSIVLKLLIQTFETVKWAISSEQVWVIRAKEAPSHFQHQGIIVKSNFIQHHRYKYI